MKYDLITWGMNVELKDPTSIRAHFDRLSSDNISYEFIAPLLHSHVSLDFSSNHVCYLGHMEPLGGSSSYGPIHEGG